MFISHETPKQIEDRLLHVIARSELAIQGGLFTFIEYPAASFPSHEIGKALAFVRDESVWSVLLPWEERFDHAERLRIFSFHFPPNLDNSGFVGWLASHLKQALGTGLLVVCGQNSKRGGVFDYWAVPAEISDDVIAEVHKLRGSSLT